MKVEVQPTPFPETIDLNSSDEDLIHYVSHRKNGDPLPPNVIVNVNPFSIEPLDADAHGDNWYLCGFEEFEYAKGGKIRAMEGGYWKQKGNDEQIHVNSQTNGRKVYWEFFRGNEPYGSRTAWMILEYHSKYKEIQDENDKQDFNSLCRIYSSNSDEPYVEERCNNIYLDENVAIDLETTLLNIGNAEDNNSKLESANESQVADKKTPLLPTERCNGYNIDSPVNSQGYDDPNEDYIMIEEIFDEICSRSSFENSSRYSEMPDDCIDAALILSLVGEGNASSGQELHSEGSAADNLPRSDRQAVNEPLSSEEVQSNGAEGIRINRTPSPGLPVGASANLFRTRRPASSWAMCIPSSSSGSSNCEGSRRQKRAPSRSSDGSASSSSRNSGNGRSPSDSQSGKSSSGSRMKRLGKYCCLGPF